jgi:hypothetical protein
MSGMSTLSTLVESSTITTATISNEDSTIATTIAPTTLVAMPATDSQSSEDNAALIGGIIGGIVALLLIVGAIAFILMRSNRKVKAHDLGQPVARPINGNYDQIDFPSSSHYSNSANVQSSMPNHYDSLTPNEVGAAKY